MDSFRLLSADEVRAKWCDLRIMLSPAVREASGELAVDDLLTLVEAGRMFIFATDALAVTVEFETYPRLTAMLVGFGAGRVGNRAEIERVLIDFARQYGASSIRTFCKSPAMVRYYRRWFNLEPTYFLLERKLNNAA